MSDNYFQFFSIVSWELKIKHNFKRLDFQFFSIVSLLFQHSHCLSKFQPFNFSLLFLDEEWKSLDASGRLLSIFLYCFTMFFSRSIDSRQGLTFNFSLLFRGFSGFAGLFWRSACLSIFLYCFSNLHFNWKIQARPPLSIFLYCFYILFYELSNASPLPFNFSLLFH